MRAFVCSYEEVKAVHQHPTPEQQLVIDDYAARYQSCMAGRIPEGLHYLPGLGPVWFGVANALEATGS